MPISAIAAVPTADQMAYVVPALRCLRTMARSAKEIAYPITTSAIGPGLENPSDALRARVAMTSEVMAAASMNAVMLGSVPSRRYSDRDPCARRLRRADRRPTRHHGCMTQRIEPLAWRELRYLNAAGTARPPRR